MQENLISVMMPAYNAEAYISQAIQSVLDQTYPHWELIIVDDGSIDNTANIISEFDDPRIKLFQKPNKGESTARNMALKNMRGEFVAFLDSDDMYLPEHLALTTNYLIDNPHYSAVYTNGYYCDSSGNLIKTLTSRRRGPFQGDVFSEAIRGSDLFGPPVSVVVRRKPIIDHDMHFDETITIGPDWVFFMQYAAVGWFGYLDSYTCLYRLHDSNISLSVDLKNRAREHAKCRIRSVHMDRFNDCPVGVRSHVFYELLINLLRNLPDAQRSIIQLEQFQRLPTKEQARLLRLVAASSISLKNTDEDLIYDWLQKSVDLDSTDLRGNVLLKMYKISPKLTKRLVEIKKRREIDPLTIKPFSDIDSSLYIDGNL